MPMTIPNDSLLDVKIADLVRGTGTKSRLLDSLIADLVRRKQEQPVQVPLPQPEPMPFESCMACGGPLAVTQNGIQCGCCGRSQ